MTNKVFIPTTRQGMIKIGRRVLHPSQLEKILRRIQDSKPEDEQNIRIPGSSSVGYKRRGDIQQTLRDTQEEGLGGDLNWTSLLIPYETPNGEIGYVLGISEYYTESLKKVGVECRSIG